MAASPNPLLQVQTLFKSFSRRRRVMIGPTARGIGAAVGWFAWHSNEAGYRPLYRSMALEDAGAMAQKLKEKNVPYRLSDNGTTILVPEGKVAESRLEMA